ncbi:nucleoside diphosphate-linked moiety X motif 17 isoform X2 [Ambystoma mexicanum]|uniref:nucleoside diphosphate-linked moiety X motif 17 isoform X2 n=1 Tax=Ambystoma mexicanum TaxID=8296 RepID=UPI0037E7EF6B
MEPMKRILVYLSRERSLPHCAKFIQRSKTCPIKNMDESQVAALPEDVRSRGVDVGVAVILQAANSKVLLTRRSSALSIFPNVWVPPGGHIEQDEQVLDAGLRELKEETGLQLKDGEFTWRMMGLWESVFPPLLSRGLPTRHHIVVYMLVLSQETHEQLQKRLCPDESEVSACAWLDPSMVELIISTNRDLPSMETQQDIPTTIGATELCNGSLVQKDLPSSAFLRAMPSEGVDVERVSTGTKFALQLWFKTVLQAK